MNELTLIESLTQTLVEEVRHREEADPDSPAWEAEARIERAQASLVALVAVTARPAIGATGSPTETLPPWTTEQ